MRLGQKGKKSRSGLLIVLVPLIFILFQQIFFGNPLSFFAAQMLWGKPVTLSALVSQVIGLHNGNANTFVWMMMTVFYACMFLMITYQLARKIRFSYAIYFGLFTIVPFFTLTFQSLNRYISIFFPVMALLAMIIPTGKMRGVFLTIFFFMALYATMLFTCGTFIG